MSARVEHGAGRGERHLRSVLDNLPVMVGYWDRDLRCRFGNKALQAWFGVDARALAGMHIRDGLGDEIFKSNEEHILAALRGEPREFDRGVSARNDRDFQDMHVQLLPDIAEGETQGIFVLMTDTTGRKRADAERETLRNQLHQAQKMEAIGQLTGGIAHDFNNILAAVLGYTALAQRVDAGERNNDLKRYLYEIQRAGERARDLVGQLLTFGRRRHGRPTTVAVAPQVREALQMLRPAFPASIGIVEDFASHTYVIVADPVQLQQIVTNLCINARDAMPSGGELNIGLRRAHVLQGTCASCQEPVNGEYIELIVGDNGQGIPPSNFARIFDPFFTTKDAGRGSGLGLSVVHGIVHDLGGHVLISSVEGQGSVFRVLFPVAGSVRSVHEEPLATTMTTAPAAVGKKIWIIDDEPALVRYLAELFDGAGYVTRQFTNPVYALREFDGDPGAMDLVVTDQTMPDVSGAELARRMLAVRPALPVILTTGYSDSIDEGGAGAIGVRVFLRKPVTPAELLTHTATLLNPVP